MDSIFDAINNRRVVEYLKQIQENNKNNVFHWETYFPVEEATKRNLEAVELYKVNADKTKDGNENSEVVKKHIESMTSKDKQLRIVDYCDAIKTSNLTEEQKEGITELLTELRLTIKENKND